MTTRTRQRVFVLLTGLLLAAASGCQKTSPTQPKASDQRLNADQVADLSHGTGSATLQVRKSGTGSGTVTSSPSGINCGSTCSKTFSRGTVVTLSATPATGSVFAGWSSGPCTGSTGPCTFTLNSSTTVTAVFNTGPPPPPGETFTLTVNKVQNGQASGVVTSSPSGINCGSTCTATFPAGTQITLTASVNAGVFSGWTGGPCDGSTSSTCTFTLNGNTTMTATFDIPPLAFIDTTLPNGNVGAEYSAFINTTGGFGSPDIFSIIAGSLPPGLVMDQSFGVQSTLIHGKPTQTGTSAFTVKVQDQSGSASQAFTITINGPVTLVITLPGPTAKSGTLGQFYFQNLFASGGETPYTWSITGGQLPPGLRVVAASNGNRIEGTPTARGTFTFALTVRDKGGQQATQQTSITIN